MLFFGGSRLHTGCDIYIVVNHTVGYCSGVVLISHDCPSTPHLIDITAMNDIALDLIQPVLFS